MGGCSQLISSLSQHLPPQHIHQGADVREIKLENGVITVHLSTGAAPNTYDQIWLAIPPRLVPKIQFSPPLPPSAVQALSNVPTWMAGQAKYVAGYKHAFWKDNGLSGGVFSQVGPLGEVHDAGHGQKAALFGFLRMQQGQRAAIGNEELKKLCRAQLIRVFGNAAANIEEDFIQDWAAEQYTATSADHIPSHSHPSMASVDIFGTDWTSHIYMMGSEAATEHAGYLEGALISAETLLQQLKQVK